MTETESDTDTVTDTDTDTGIGTHTGTVSREGFTSCLSLAVPREQVRTFGVTIIEIGL